MEGKIIYIDKNVVWKRKEYGSMFYNTVSKEKIKLDLVATMMVEKCNGVKSINEIVKELSEYWEVEEKTLYQDIMDFYSTMINHGMMTLESSKGTGVILEEPNPTLNSVSFQITNRCNLRCKHCFVSSGELMGEELKTNEIKKVFDSLQKMKVLEVTLTGGEPLIREDFFEIAQYANDKNITLSIFTNGVLCTDEVIEKLANLKLTNIQVSLDGVTPEVNDIVRGEGIYLKVVDNIKKMVEKKLPVHIGATITKQNYFQMKDFVNLAIDLGVTGVNASEVMIMGRAEENKNLLELTPDEIADMRIFYGLESILNKKIQVGSGFDFAEFVSPFQEEGDKKNAKMEMCNAGRSTCTIMWDGIVVPCQSFDTAIFGAGNIKNEDITDIWQDSKIFEQMRSLSVDQFNMCKNCEYKYLCAGGCRAIVFNETGDIYAEPDKKTCYWKLKFYNTLDKELKQRYGASFSEQWDKLESDKL